MTATQTVTQTVTQLKVMKLLEIRSSQSVVCVSLSMYLVPCLCRKKRRKKVTIIDVGPEETLAETSRQGTRLGMLGPGPPPLLSTGVGSTTEDINARVLQNIIANTEAV